MIAQNNQNNNQNNVNKWVKPGAMQALLNQQKIIFYFRELNCSSHGRQIYPTQMVINLFNKTMTTSEDTTNWARLLTCLVAGQWN